ncbi:MAG: hypothetical protein ACQ9MH_14350 [Nitrospinales bacterium]
MLETFILKIRFYLCLNFSTLKNLKLWLPGSLNCYRYPEVTNKNARDYPRVLSQLEKYGSSPTGSTFVEILQSTDFGKDNADLDKMLSTHFTKQGSDKATDHDYTGIYADFISKLETDQPLKILEIGIGTNKQCFLSSMGEGYIPGSSLRAYRDVFPKAKIYGADLDRDILFTEQNIKTAWADQMDQNSFTTMTDDLGETEFDLIIDDGLHAITANINTLLFALNHLREGGVFIVEDILKRTLPAWSPVINMLKENYHCGLISCKNGHVFFLRRDKDGSSAKRD